MAQNRGILPGETVSQLDLVGPNPAFLEGIRRAISAASCPHTLSPTGHFYLLARFFILEFALLRSHAAFETAQLRGFETEVGL